MVVAAARTGTVAAPPAPVDVVPLAVAAAPLPVVASSRRTASLGCRVVRLSELPLLLSTTASFLHSQDTVSNRVVDLLSRVYWIRAPYFVNRHVAHAPCRIHHASMSEAAGEQVVLDVAAAGGQLLLQLREEVLASSVCNVFRIPAAAR